MIEKRNYIKKNFGENFGEKEFSFREMLTLNTFRIAQEFWIKTRSNCAFNFKIADSCNVIEIFSVALISLFGQFNFIASEKSHYGLKFSSNSLRAAKLTSIIITTDALSDSLFWH